VVPRGADREPVTLRIPADASQIGTVRILAGAIGRHVGLSDERVEDLKLVLSELCAEAVEASGPGGFVEMRFEQEADSLAIEVRTPATSSQMKRNDSSDQRRRLLDALVPSTGTVLERAERVVRFRLP
jgi:anti-sigma regulatory factor (Ser/Thr protein kinase)